MSGTYRPAEDPWRHRRCQRDTCLHLHDGACPHCGCWAFVAPDEQWLADVAAEVQAHHDKHGEGATA